MRARPFEIEDEPTVEHDPDIIERYYRAQVRLTAALLDHSSYLHGTAPPSSDGPRSVPV